MARPFGAGRPPLVLVTFILGAVAFGAAAVLLAAPAAPPPNVSSGSNGGVTVNDAALAATLLLVALVVVPLVIFLLNRRSDGASVVPTRPIAFALIVILLLTAFVFFAHFGGGGLTPGHVAPPPGNNSSGGTPPNGTGNLTNVTHGLFGLTIPTWAWYVLVIGVAVVAALILVPWLMARGEPSVPVDRRREQLRAGLTQAISELSQETGGTPRERIIQVYARWLKRIVRGTGDLSALTAREIEANCVSQLGIRPETAHELTALFEEARYSTHPMDESAVLRAQQALVRALDEFDRAHPVAPHPVS